MSENELAAAIGKRIGDLRERAGLTQAQLAERSGVSIHTLRNWEQGHREPLAGAVIALARALGVSADELLGMPPMGAGVVSVTELPKGPPARPSPVPGTDEPPAKRGRPKKADAPAADVKPKAKRKGSQGGER